MNSDDMPGNSARIRAILEAAGLRYENGCAVSPNDLWDPVPVDHLDMNSLIEVLIVEVEVAAQDRGFQAGRAGAQHQMRAALGL